MTKENSQYNTKVIEALKHGEVVVMPTDTIYGIVGRAENQKTVEKIYKIRKRAPDKPCIILISGLTDLPKFRIFLTPRQTEAIKNYWPGPVSIVFDCLSRELQYLHRGTNTLALRYPKNEELQKLLAQTGPLVVPSANLEGMPPARDIAEAKKYFGDEVDMYVDGGELSGTPSKIISLTASGEVIVIRA
jgi:L-threonylcarbamoyladenylate synthase